MLFKIEKLRIILQQTQEQVLYFYSTMATKKRADRLPLKKIEGGQSVTSYLNKTV